VIAHLRVAFKKNRNQREPVWDNLLRGKFSKQWKIQPKAYTTRRKLRNPFLYAKAQRRKKREAIKKEKDNKTKKKNKTEDFHEFFKPSFLSYKKCG
jgi:hypothetical protein